MMHKFVTVKSLGEYYVQRALGCILDLDQVGIYNYCDQTYNIYTVGENLSYIETVSVLLINKDNN